jgi:AcrR family transcriptional regulator
MTTRWLQRELEASAADRILDAAGSLFASQGVARTNMGDVATAAGCSRATLYRYFESRDVLRVAFVNRTARRVEREVNAEVAHLTDPGEYVVEAILAALRRVRTDPELAAWWEPSAVAIASELTGNSAVIEGLAAAFVGDIEDPEVRAVATWLVRVVVAFLVMPGESEQAEREALQRFVAPAISSLASTMTGLT